LHTSDGSNERKETTMRRKLIATIGAAATLGALGAGAATAAGYNSPVPGWGNRADCPYATTETPLRIHAQDGTGQNARDGAPLHALDGTGPHGPWAGGR
jgi:anaerobic selenocysteine-containing dehydrogenase